MGTGDYICVTLHGGAPWGFNLTEGEGDTYRPFIVSQVEEGGRAFLGGVQDGDEVVSVNGEPCADLTLLRALALIDTSIDSLQLLVKRYHSITPEDDESESGERASSGEPLESTTLHIISSKHKSQIPKELYISESQDEAYYVELDSDVEFPKGPRQFYTSSSVTGKSQENVFRKKDEDVQRCFSPGNTVELQVSLSQQTLDDVGCASLGSARGIEGSFSNRELVDAIPTITTSHCVPSSIREPLSQHGVVVSSPSLLGQVEVILQQPTASAARGGGGRGIQSVGGPRVIESVGSQSEEEEEGGGGVEQHTGVPGSFSVSFEISSEGGSPAEEQGSDSEGDRNKPSKHRARHARLRRSESLSEKQVKEAKSKCKRIALLLTAAPPNPNNKGVLMFKKHRQRAKKYTLVSYGTGEDEPEYYSDEEGEENGDDRQETHTVEFTLLPPNDPDIDKGLLTNAQSSKGVLSVNFDKGLLEIERNLNNQAEMECLPETKGKGALMFAQRRLRMDEITAEHEELRRQGMPVEGVQETNKKIMEQSYMQATTEGHAYMDVNMHHQTQQQQYQQYQEQQYYEQQQNYQQQQQYQQYQQQQHHQQQQQYEQRQYQQQQMYQQEYHQEQQQMQHYATNINGNVQQETSEMQSSFSNRTAKPFTVENMPTAPYSHAISGTNQDSVGQGEQIASRDERISTPAIKTGFLQDARRRNAGKPMFTFKEAPKVSPNPALLNLLNKSDKKQGFESGPEEDYLSLGAEACNFLQSQRFKNKIPPPVAPKPVINPISPPWSTQIEVTNQDMPQCAENSLSTPAVAPTMESAPAPELEPTPAPAPEPSPPPAPQEAPASTATVEQPMWTIPEPESQHQPVQVTAQEANGHMNATLQPEPSPVTWGSPQPQAQTQVSSNSWHPAQVQPQEPLPSQSPPQPPWVTRQPSQNQVQVQPPTNTWNSQPQQPPQPSWSQPQEQAQPQTHAQPPWVQSREPPQSQPQVQPPWAHTNEQPHLQQIQPSWSQAPEPIQPQPQNPWTQPSQTDSQHQPPWMQQPQKESQPQPPWVQQAQPESQPQPPWVQQPQHQALQQTWPQVQAPVQPQPSWVSAQPQQQPTLNAWPPSQTQAQVQPPWVQAQPQAQPQANLNPWAPVPTQAQSQPSWGHQPQEHGQPPMNSWAQEQNQAQHQPPWAQPVPPQPTPQPNWQQSTSKTPPQLQMNTWPPAQTQPQTPMNAWAPQSQQTPANVSTSIVNTRPSPKPWLPPQNAPESRTPPPPPQRLHSFNIGQRASSPINPMATVLNPSPSASALEMPVVRGKGADMFAKRQSRMEKFVVDSETVEANKASRSTSPAASLPNEWKYSPNVRAPPPRAYNPIQSPFYPPAATKQPPPSSPSTKAKKKEKEKQKQMPAPKPLNVIDVMKHQPYQLSSSLFIFGPEPEPPKPAPQPCSPINPPVDNQPIMYEPMAPVQPTGPYGAPYPQQPYGMPMQPMMHEEHYQQTQANLYPPSNPYQQPPGGLYQQAYNQQYQQPPPPAYHPQAPQSPNSPYQQAMQAAYQPANSPPYLATPSAPYQQQLPSSYVTPSFPVAARPESASGSAPATAPKPKFMAKKSSAQVWKPSAGDKE
ncbi:synaptopodin-2 [Parambassis ranga]|uniref:Synaptopodin-2 n=1 Tax=Parambassis ranga TaxID=210632 RepID=A0A6P7KB25_9TELE|nr:synaptopodin-2-like [Parambassis ranga]